MSTTAGTYQPVPQSQQQHEKYLASDFQNNSIHQNQGRMSKQELPQIPVNLRKHKLALAINWSILITLAGIMPVILFFALKYCTSLQLSTVIAIPTAVFGVGSLYNLVMRTYRLTKKTPFYRPIGGSRWGFDFFHWNFMAGFIYITIIIIIGNIIVKDHPETSVRIISMPHSVLLLIVGTELIIAEVLILGRVNAPFRLSSIEKGSMTRPGVYIIAEDICAVDGGQGEKFRIPFDERYKASPIMRSLLSRLDWMWGVSAVCVGGGIQAVIWAVHDPEIGYAVGWLVPWIYAIIFSVITIKTTQAALRKEAEMFGTTSI